MKKIFGLFMAVLLMINLVQAIDLDVSVNPVTNAVVAELDQPATFDLVIQNNGESGEFEMYSLVGVELIPKIFTIKNEGIKTIRTQALLNDPSKSRKIGRASCRERV